MDFSLTEGVLGLVVQDGIAVLADNSTGNSTVRLAPRSYWNPLERDEGVREKARRVGIRNLGRDECMGCDSTGRLFLQPILNYRHAEADTAIACVIDCMRSGRLSNAADPAVAVGTNVGRNWRQDNEEMDCEYLVISKDTEVSLVLLLQVTLRGCAVVHACGSNFVFLDAWHQCLAEVQLSAEEIVLLHALVGRDFVPFTRFVTPQAYILSYVSPRLGSPSSCQLASEANSTEYS